MQGKSGQFDVFADGDLVASRQGSLLVRLVGGGWPDADEVTSALEQRLATQKA